MMIGYAETCISTTVSNCVEQEMRTKDETVLDVGLHPDSAVQSSRGERCSFSEIAAPRSSRNCTHIWVLQRILITRLCIAGLYQVIHFIDCSLETRHSFEDRCTSTRGDGMLFNIHIEEFRVAVRARKNRAGSWHGKCNLAEVTTSSESQSHYLRE